MIKKLSKQGLIASDRILNLAKDLTEEEPNSNNILDYDEYPVVIPRIFPNPKVPSKVAAHRKIKEFAAVDLN